MKTAQQCHNKAEPIKWEASTFGPGSPSFPALPKVPGKPLKRRDAEQH